MDKVWRGAARPLGEGVFTQAARRLGCEEAALRAVWDVEAGGRYWAADGGVLRRFEPHHMPGSSLTWRDSLGIGAAERERLFLQAYERDSVAALRATSWGAPQIMGFNAQAAGYGGAAVMVRAMAQGADAHVEAFVHLIFEWGLDAALRAQDWHAFARRYNGSGQPEVYARKMAAAYRRHTGTPSAQVLGGARGAGGPGLRAADGGGRARVPA